METNNNTATATATVTITINDWPSRSKQAGPTWLTVDGEYYDTDATISFPIGAVIEAAAKATLRKARTGAAVHTDRETLVVTGDPADTMQMIAGAAQYVEATITGVKRA